MVFTLDLSNRFLLLSVQLRLGRERITLLRGIFCLRVVGEATS